MKSKIAVISIGIVLTLAVTSCAPSVVTSTENSVIIEGGNIEDALQLAEASCKAYGKSAQFVRYDDQVTYYWIFNCF